MKALFAVDLEEGDARVAARLTEAAAVLDRLEATVDLLFVDPYFPAQIVPDQPEEVARLFDAAVERRDASQRTRLDALLAGIPAARRGTCGVIRDRKPSDEITARATGYDLLVVGTHGRRGLARAWLGSVAEKVVRASPIPALVMHGVVGTGPILAAVDLGDRPDALLADAATWAQRIGARVDAIHVLPPPIAPDPGLIGYSAGWIEGIAGSERASEAELAKLLEALPAPIRGVGHLERGDPAAAIASAAERHALVVVRTHGRTGLGRFWLGSVAERVIRRSPVPVLVLPPAHH